MSEEPAQVDPAVDRDAGVAARAVHVALPVLAHSGKVDRLKEELAAERDLQKSQTSQSNPNLQTMPAATSTAPSTLPTSSVPSTSASEKNPATISPTISPPPVSHPTPLDFGHAMHKSPEGLSPAQRSIEATIVEVIRTIYDPEIPVNIYDLGLIYQIDIDAENKVEVKMTLTAPGCPVAGSLPVEVMKKIESIPQVTSANVELVWEPQWDKSRMSDAAMLDLGMY
jgi:FeS assembly SUF system protein